MQRGWAQIQVREGMVIVWGGLLIVSARIADGPCRALFVHRAARRGSRVWSCSVLICGGRPRPDVERREQLVFGVDIQ